LLLKIKLKSTSFGSNRRQPTYNLFFLFFRASTKEIFETLTSAATVKPFLILVIYFFIFQFSGINTLTFYTVEIVRDTGTTWDKFSCTISIGIVRLIFTILSAVALRRAGRRSLTFLSSIGCGLTMLGLGGYLYYKHIVDTSDPPGELLFTWFPIFCLFVYFIVCPLGYLVVPWVMIGELYPQKVQVFY
jgi:facilitated trehalose transporter